VRRADDSKKREARVLSKVVACVLALLVCLSGTPGSAARLGPASSEGYWIEATLVSVDMAQRKVTYRVATGEVGRASVLAGDPLRKLASFHPGQRMRLRCTPGDADLLVVEAKKGGGRNWWKWGVLTFLGFFLVVMLWAASSPGSDALL
jgi:hypothetical protein